jgi:hypothetical protein
MAHQNIFAQTSIREESTGEKNIRPETQNEGAAQKTRRQKDHDRDGFQEETRQKNGRIKKGVW